MAKKKTARKCNRVHYFQRKKSTGRKVGHPVYLYGRSGSMRKYLVITHKPETGKENDYHLLKHNIDPDEKDRSSYVKKKYEVNDKSKLREPDKKYRIHKDDIETIKKYKK